LPETFWNKSNACFWRFQNSSASGGLKQLGSLIFSFALIYLPKYSLIGKAKPTGRLIDLIYLIAGVISKAQTRICMKWFFAWKYLDK